MTQELNQAGVEAAQPVQNLHELIERAKRVFEVHPQSTYYADHPTVVGNELIDAIASLTAQIDAMRVKLERLRHEREAVANFVRPRIPADQNPEQAESYLAWIGMICRLEERAETAEARADSAWNDAVEACAGWHDEQADQQDAIGAAGNSIVRSHHGHEAYRHNLYATAIRNLRKEPT